jgi:hypothetical protein
MPVLFLLRAFVFHRGIVATLGSKTYHWGTFIAAEMDCGDVDQIRISGFLLYIKEFKTGIHKINPVKQHSFGG